MKILSHQYHNLILKSVLWSLGKMTLNNMCLCIICLIVHGSSSKDGVNRWKGSGSCEHANFSKMSAINTDLLWPICVMLYVQCEHYIPIKWSSHCAGLAPTSSPVAMFLFAMQIFPPIQTNADRSILDGIKLGTIMFDTCGSEPHALQQVSIYLLRDTCNHENVCLSCLMKYISRTCWNTAETQC